MGVIIAVPIKAVLDIAGDPSFADNRLVRDGELLLNDADENALESALVAAETLSADVVAVTMGPPEAEPSLRRALQMGAASAVHVLDPRIVGSDALATARVLAAALHRLQGTEGLPLVITGESSVDAATGLVPGMLAELLGRPILSHATALTLADGQVRIRRSFDGVEQDVSAALPVLVSVADGSNEPRYPTFKDVMAAKRKPLQVWDLDDLGIDPLTVGTMGILVNTAQSARPHGHSPQSGLRVVQSVPVEAKAGRVVVDSGEGGRELARFLVAAGFGGGRR